MFEQISFNDTMMITVTGIVIVFLVLILLIVILSVYGRVIYRAQSGKKQKEDAAVHDDNTEDHLPAQRWGIMPNQIVSADEEELIAVIAAAVEAYAADSGVKYRVRSVRQISGRPVWAQAGVYENTRPF